MNGCRCKFGSFVTMTLKCLGGAAIAFHYPAIPAYAVDEIQVYNADIAAPGTFTLQQHLNYVWSGSANSGLSRWLRLQPDAQRHA